MRELEFFKFNVPEAQKKKVYAVRLKDGRVVVRSEEELEELKEQEKQEEQGE